MERGQEKSEKEREREEKSETEHVRASLSVKRVLERP